MTEKRYAYPIDKEQREQLLAIKAATGASFGWMITCAIAEWLDKHAVPGSVAGMPSALELESLHPGS